MCHIEYVLVLLKSLKSMLTLFKVKVLPMLFSNPFVPKPLILIQLFFAPRENSIKKHIPKKAKRLETNDVLPQIH